MAVGEGARQRRTDPSPGAADADEPVSTKPEKILAAAQRLLATRGHASLTVGEIAQEAGVSRGLLHYYFASKEDILAQLVRRNTEMSLEIAVGFFQSAGSRAELIDLLMDAYREALSTRPSLYSTYFEAYVQGRAHPPVRDELAELYRARREALAAGLETARDQGLIALPHEPLTVAALIIALADGAALQFLIDPSLPTSEVQSGATTLFERLLTDVG